MCCLPWHFDISHRHTYTLPTDLLSKINVYFQFLEEIQQQIKDFVEQNRNPAFGYASVYDLRHMETDDLTLVCVFLVDHISESAEVYVNLPIQSTHFNGLCSLNNNFSTFLASKRLEENWLSPISFRLRTCELIVSE